MDFLESQRSIFPDLESQYSTLLVQHQSRLWHQLTDSLLALLTHPGASRGDNFIQLYDRFLSTFETRLNQLKFTQMLNFIALQYLSSRPAPVSEVDQALRFLESFEDKGKRLGDDGFAVLRATIAEFKIRRALAQSDADARTADLEAAKTALEASKQLMDAIVDADPAVQAAYFHAAAQYHKVRGPASAYYLNAMQYLAYVPASSVPVEERHSLAVDVALSALVGDGVFNFGEIIEHPILSSLEGTPDAWLRDLLAVFHTGDVDAFNLVVSSNQTAFQSQPALVAMANAVKEKVALVCTMELASQRSPAERSITFAEIAGATRLPLEQVEWLLMRAMSLGLIRGSIDEVGQIVHISFIKPRVLNATQVVSLKEKMMEWSEKVKTSMFFVEDKTRELFA